jgi:DNA-binding MarR family transcriptional regulator
VDAEPAELRRRLARRDLAAAQFRAAARRRLGVDDTAMLALVQLGDRGSLTPTALSRLVALGSAGITAALQRLDAGDWIQRRSHPTDGRSQLVCLSRSGACRAEAIYRPLARDLETLAGELTPELRWTLARFLTRAAAVTERHAELLLAGYEQRRTTERSTSPTSGLWA